jgi:AraC-like DNA-binding protein
LGREAEMESDVDTFRASDLAARPRTAAWAELLATHLDKLEFTPADGDAFEAELHVLQLGPLRIVRLKDGAGALIRAPRHIGHAPVQVYAALLLLSGAARFSQYGREAALEEGDLVLCDMGAPYGLHLEGGAEIAVLRAPGPILREHLPSPESFCGRRLAAAEGVTCAIAAVTTSLCSGSPLPLSPEFQNRYARHLLDMIATSYAVAFDSLVGASSIASGRNARVKLFIEQHLRDPELTPRTIALRLRLSSRYLRMIFAAGNEKISAYILRRRLEECARQMADPRWRGHSITEIAFAWGFNSAPHFTRSFRERYGLSPRDYRRRQLDERTEGATAWRGPGLEAAA